MVRRILLPKFVITELSDESDPAAIRITEALEPYLCRPKLVPDEGRRRDGKPLWVKHEFNRFPVVLDAKGVPWAEGMIYIMSCVEGKSDPEMAYYASIADDLGAYRRFLDEHDVDWTEFPENKLKRPTYRFRGHLKYSIAAGEIATSTARRRMSAVIAFYRWLQQEMVFIPLHPAWVEKSGYFQYRDRRGFQRAKKFKTTDLKIDVPKEDDPYDGTIQDGAKLRPLPLEEQQWLFDALEAIGNTEMTLIHLFALLTGARIQTVLTIRIKDLFFLRPCPREEDAKRTLVRNVDESKEGESKATIRLPVGYGTGIDTKFGKQMVLHIPHWFIEKLRTYANSRRCRDRRMRAVGGDREDQYLFLSRRGVPFYESKIDSKAFNNENGLRHVKSGQAVRQFITEKAIPYIRQAHRSNDFHYRFHDLRATAGMNWMDDQLELVAQGRLTLHEALEFVRVRLGHESLEVTERYLNFRRRLAQVRWAEERHEEYLKELCEHAMQGDL